MLDFTNQFNAKVPQLIHLGLTNGNAKIIENRTIEIRFECIYDMRTEKMDDYKKTATQFIVRLLKQNSNFSELIENEVTIKLIIEDYVGLILLNTPINKQTIANYKSTDNEGLTDKDHIKTGLAILQREMPYTATDYGCKIQSVRYLTPSKIAFRMVMDTDKLYLLNLIPKESSEFIVYLLQSNGRVPFLTMGMKPYGLKEIAYSITDNNNMTYRQGEIKISDLAK